jgi:CBS domain-containing protein
MRSVMTFYTCKNLNKFREIEHIMPTGIKVSDAMLSRVVTAKPSQTILDASKIMKKEDVGSLIVVEGAKPIGIITREDIVSKVVAKNAPPSKMLIQEVMSKKLVTIPPDSDISEAARAMSKHKYERMPVVSMGRLIGILSAREIAKVAPAALEVMTEHLRIEEPQNFPANVQAGECEKCGNFSEELHNINDIWVCDTCKEESQV